MYRVTVQTLTGNELNIYYPGDQEYILTNAKLKYDIGLAGEFNFTIPVTNPSYSQITYDSIITVYKDDIEFWRGDIRNIRATFDKSLEVYCLEDMAWLGEEPLAMTQVIDQTYSQRFSAAITTYNSNQATKRQFTVGQLTAVSGSGACAWVPEYEMNTLDGLRKFIAGSNGYLKVRRVTSGGSVTRYIDIVTLSDYGKQSSQTIEFGSNLLDYAKVIDATGIINALYPYGAETETELYGDIMQRMVGTPIQNNDSIAAYGRRAKAVVFDTDNATTLSNLASAYLSRYSQPHVEIEVTAVDLGSIDIVDDFAAGDSVRVLAPVYAIDQWLYITSMEVDLLNPASNQIKLTDVLRNVSLTSQVISQGTEIKDIRTPASVLDEAKRNAWAIFEGDNGGIVTFDINGSEQIVGIHIANNLDLDQATKAWGWNINGLVYLHRTYPTDDWTVGIAMTMNGEIVADYVTTGTMSADRVRTGTLESHNYSYSSGNFNNTGTIIDMDNGLIRTPGFKADGSGNVYIASGAVIGGYAKDSDIPDVSGFATTAGLAAGTTTISGNCITTGKLSADRVEGGTLILGGTGTSWTKMNVEDNNGNYLGGIADAWYANELYVYGADNPNGWNEISIINGNDGWRTLGIGNTSSSRTWQFTYRPYVAGQMIDLYPNDIGYRIILEDGNGTEVYYYDVFGSSELKYRDNSSHTTPLSFAYCDAVDTAGEFGPAYTGTSGEIYEIPKGFGDEVGEFIVLTLTVNNQLTLWNAGVRRIKIKFSYFGYIVGIRADGIYGNHRGTFNGYANIYDSGANLLLDNASREIHLVQDTNNKIDIAYDDITQTVSGTAKHPIWSASDERVKEDIEPLNLDLSKSLIDATRPKRFKFKNTDGIHYGVTAQDMREILDNIGETDSELEHSMGLPKEKTGLDDERMVEYLEFIPHLINYVKDLRAEVVALKNIINTLKEDK